LTRESGLTHSDLKEGDVLISVDKYKPILLVLSVLANVDDLVLIRLLDLQEGSVFPTRKWVNTPLPIDYTLHREEGGA